tara:strand:+ start:1399 stop:1617 length:219 start_codon:yes stop_codon:yes gene_type:complete
MSASMGLARVFAEAANDQFPALTVRPLRTALSGPPTYFHNAAAAARLAGIRCECDGRVGQLLKAQNSEDQFH